MHPTSCLPSPPFLFSLLAVSGLSAKVLHILQHVHSLHPLYLIIYLPTLFLVDFLVISFGRLLLRTPDNSLQLLGCVVGGVLALVTFGASAIQFGFFFQTGSEVEWSASNSFLRDPAAMKLLMSGIWSVFSAGAVILVVSWLLSPHLHTLVGAGFEAIRNGLCKSIKAQESLLPLPVLYRSSWNLRWWMPAIAITISLLVLEASRPSVPYDHLSEALPLTLLHAFHGKAESCPAAPIPFPFPDLISEEKWESPQGDYPGWNPGKVLKPDETPERPAWLPERLPPGFQRWKTRHDAADGCSGRLGAYPSYSPALDPLKISNLDLDILEPLRQAFQETSIEINHIVMVTLESARKEVFPMQASTPLYDIIVESHDDERQRNRTIDKLSRLTPVAQMVTGEYALNSKGERNNFSDVNWQDHSAPGMGGINVKGAVTGSTLTLKSLLGSHCGVSPLPVDLLEEVKYDIYQPCLPHILELFNRAKSDSSGDEAKSPEDFQERPWNSVFLQSITDTYDRQRRLNYNIGFNQSVVKETLDSPFSRYYPPKTDEINYFGYAEEEVKPYLRDFIFDAAQNKTRLFLSHVTSSTHHPWNVPKSFHKEQYMGRGGRSGVNHRPMNDYLNTVRYDDEWLGEILGLLDEAKIADSTLVVLVGDHGQAFAEDTKVTGTFENGHISNFRVPLVFRHPRLPRIDISANVTSLSIIPTILDLLVQTHSLNEHDSRIASALMHEYQGQSLLRPFRSSHNGRQVWNMGLINAGGALLSVASAEVPYRLVLPLKEGFQYRFTHLERDPAEKRPLEAWELDRLQTRVLQAYGQDAANWLKDAAKVGRWWVAEQKRIWNYRG